jgi:hypothetical protein
MKTIWLSVLMPAYMVIGPHIGFRAAPALMVRRRSRVAAVVSLQQAHLRGVRRLQLWRVVGHHSIEVLH